MIGTHFPARAKRVIYLFMSGAPPQMDTLDYKPGLSQWFDKDLPESVRGTATPTGMTSGQSRFPIAPSHWAFKQYGQCGRWISDVLPWTGKMADDIAVLNSVHTDAINHEPAILLMNTGNMVPGKPAMGAWLSYGLGSMNENLPAFVVLKHQSHRREHAADHLAPVGQWVSVIATRRRAPARRSRSRPVSSRPQGNGSGHAANASRRRCRSESPNL